MTTAGDGGPKSAEAGSALLQGRVDDKDLTLDMVSALAGDRPLTLSERAWLDGLKLDRGPLFFSDLLYAVTHQHFPPEAAETLWADILRHKLDLSTTLQRNVRIAVATLDYLSNITPNMIATTLIGEHHMAAIIDLSLKDGLTGLFNHTYFYQQIELEVRRFARYGTALSLILIDIDDFKSINDRFGHQEGDRALAAMGKALLRTARDSDICCRYGGEEFAVILPLTLIHEAEQIAGRIRAELAACLPGASFTVTVSLGVASCDEKTRTSRALVKRADMALYRAKRKGKNRVELGIDA